MVWFQGGLILCDLPTVFDTKNRKAALIWMLPDDHIRHHWYNVFIHFSLIVEPLAFRKWTDAPRYWLQVNWCRWKENVVSSHSTVLACFGWVVSMQSILDGVWNTFTWPNMMNNNSQTGEHQNPWWLGTLANPSKIDFTSNQCPKEQHSD